MPPADGPAMKKPQHFVFVLVEDFSHLAFACAVEPLRIANLLSGETLYRWSFASEDGQSATCSNRSVTLVHHGLDKLPVCDRLFILSGINMRQHVTRPLLNAAARGAPRNAHRGAVFGGVGAGRGRVSQRDEGRDPLGIS
jgi:transcriptional regulator GlxA family with amidase domain